METTTPCTCIYDKDKGLRDMGYKLAPDIIQIGMRDSDLTPYSIYGLPIVPSEKRRKRKGDATTIRISHCPFCGKPLNQN